MEELVSIIIPAYQEEKRIERCLKSIVASTYQRIEIIVVDDGSTDHTGKRVMDFKDRHNFGKISIKLITTENGGSARARNLGLCEATGNYIGFVDADDMIHPHMLSRLVKSLRKGNDLALCGLLFCDENGKPKLRQYRLGKQRVRCPGQAMEMVMWKQIQMSMCSVLFRRTKIINREGKPEVLCPEDTEVFEDFAFVCRYISRCKGFMKILPFRGYFYCKRKKSLTTKIYTAKQIRYALQPVLAVGSCIQIDNFTAHKLQYAFRFMAFWYESALRDGWCDFSPDCDEWVVCMHELERYADIYMMSESVSLYKKIAMWIVTEHPVLGKILAKSIGRFII